jgi:hypothetical protein
MIDTHKFLFQQKIIPFGDHLGCLTEHGDLSLLSGTWLIEKAGKIL